MVDEVDVLQVLKTSAMKPVTSCSTTTGPDPSAAASVKVERRTRPYPGLEEDHRDDLNGLPAPGRQAPPASRRSQRWLPSARAAMTEGRDKDADAFWEKRGPNSA